MPSYADITFEGAEKAIYDLDIMNKGEIQNLVKELFVPVQPLNQLVVSNFWEKFEIFDKVNVCVLYNSIEVQMSKNSNSYKIVERYYLSVRFRWITLINDGFYEFPYRVYLSVVFIY